MSMDNRRGPNSPKNAPQQRRPLGGGRFSLMWIILLGVAVLGNIIIAPLFASSSGSRLRKAEVPSRAIG